MNDNADSSSSYFCLPHVIIIIIIIIITISFHPLILTLLLYL
jgi:hypothetical protein